ncbi:MAG TPA: glycosyltransferase family A protein [Dongiaceae bacterium]|nr:glycosyltransferase family A protein [Dongiaceae bacterium]
MDEPEISVVVPTRDRADLLPRALASALAQEGASFEVIVVDDGSSDGTAEYLASVADPRLAILRNPAPEGAAAARNRGLAAARAPVTAFLDDDDELLPGFLAASLAAHRRPPQTDLCWTGVIFALPDGRQRIERWSRSAGSRRFVIRLAGCCGISFRTAYLRELGGFDAGFAISEDTDLFMRLVEAGGRWRCIPEPLIRVHAQSRASLSRSAGSERHIAHLQKLLARHGPLIDSDPALWRRYHSSLAMHLYRGGRIAEARGELGRLLARLSCLGIGLEIALRFELRRALSSRRVGGWT